jgi:hypothetical protein
MEMPQNYIRGGYLDVGTTDEHQSRLGIPRTHLVLWMPSYYYQEDPLRTPPAFERMPMWMRDGPFEMMGSLTALGCVLPIELPQGLTESDVVLGPTEMAVIHLPKGQIPFQLVTTDSAVGEDTVQQGMIRPFYVGARADEPGASRILDWEKAWAGGQSEWSWEALCRKSELAKKTTFRVQAALW